MKSPHLLWLAALGALTLPVLAFSPVKPGSARELQFHPAESRLSDAAKVDLARDLPKIEMLNVEVLIVGASYSTDRQHPQPTKAVAIARTAAIAKFYEQAGIPKARIFPLVKAATAEFGPTNSVTILWSGWCKPERHADCQAEYFKPSASAASQPTQSLPARSP